jgi:hypothetical protein
LVLLVPGGKSNAMFEESLSINLVTFWVMGVVCDDDSYQKDGGLKYFQ